MPDGPPNPDAANAQPPAAPRWGYLKDGITPRKGPGGRKAKNVTGPPNKPAGAPAPGTVKKPATATPRKVRKNYAPIFEQGLELGMGIAQSPKVPVPYKLDLGVLYLNRVGLAKAGDELAHEAFKKFPKLEPAIDKLVSMGPRATNVSVALAVGAQILHNHGLLPPMLARFLKVVSPDQISGQLQDDAVRRLRDEGQDPDAVFAQARQDAEAAGAPA